MNNKGIFFVFSLLAIVAVLLVNLQLHNKQYATENSITQNNAVEKSLNLAFLDIGQGDATFVTFPDGQQMLIDCAINARILEALGRVMPYYDRSLDYLVITHPDMDHYGGCVDVLNRFDVKNIVYTGFEKETSYFGEFMEAVVEENTSFHQIEAFTTWDIASTTITFLYPDHPVHLDSTIPGTGKQANSNNTSMVMKLSYGNMDVLLPGDAEKELEAYLVQTYPEFLDVEVLKAAHHGSSGSSQPDFLQKVTPDHTIFSAGINNSYGHPSKRVIKRIERLNSETWRTDTQGDILMSLFQDKVYVETIPTLY